MTHLILFFIIALINLLRGEKSYENLLEENGFVILDKSYKQGFEAYVNPTEPIFITSDSLLMAFHRIYENVVMERELSTLDCDRKIAVAIIRNLPKVPESDTPEAIEGWKIARLYTATAYRILFGTLPQGLQEEEIQQAEEEFNRVKQAKGKTLPPWLVSSHYPDDFAVSYGFFKPVGPWASKPLLRSYFRYRKWMQETPFSLHDPTHRVAFTLLKNSLEKSKFPPRPSGHSKRPLTLSILEWARPDLVLHNSDQPNIKNILASKEASKQLFYFLPSDKVNDRALLDGLIRSRNTDSFGLCTAASFGNSFSQESLTKELRPLADRFSQITPLKSALSALNRNKDERLPSLFKSSVWSRKQANTICGSWTEWKYTQSLSQKEHLFVLASMRGPDPGFLEPYPDFYRLLADSAKSLSETIPAPNQQLASQKILSLLDLVETLGSEKENGLLMLQWSNRQVVSELEEIGQQLFPPTNPFAHLDRGIEYEQLWLLDDESRFELASKLREICASWMQGDEAAINLVDSFQLKSADLDSHTRLLKLSSLALRLQEMAERQLNNQGWEEKDLSLLDNFGGNLASLMYYEGNAYRVRDDAPRIVRFASEETRSYHVAIARPRKIIVRYPKADGSHVDCVGSVYAFRQHTAKQTPNNEEWAEDCGSSPWLDWMKVIVREQ